ncbi:LTA synthase family protein [Guptibacillus hwajinpoensis]|uniref:Phosphoglycerol transferase MdoB-like AlkP superfamily enzyme n=1 Tax=Guptibacillus hwajinpoensis TaxID=208199 RepID=A0ABU0K359_9BACL|nr:LTA synthase family protein [Alkalihalobacillus hemicentroti]MDQ0483798.1 phosphoglycerol transferase MdoB-like AlkP superfamily enzyme [Alkalihalobacillus hemicentroti]
MVILDYWIYVLLSILKIFLFSFYTTTAFDFNIFLVNLAGILILSSWTLLLNMRKRRWVLFTLLFLHSTLLLSDMWYYRYFSDLLSVSLLSQMFQMSDVGGGFMTLIQLKDFVFFIDLALFSFVIYFLHKKGRKAAKKTRLLFAGATLFTGVILFVTPLYTSYVNKEKWLVNSSISDMREYYHLGFWGYHGADLLTFVKQQLNEDTDVNVTVKNNQPMNKDSKITNAPNIILVQLESFQDSLIDKEINDQVLTPNLNALKEESLYFPSFYHQTHEGRTSDAEFITNTSLYPLKSGSVYTRYPTNEFAALPELLQYVGYETAAMHAYEKDFWNRDRSYKNLGYDHFFSDQNYPDGEKIGMALNDKRFFTESIKHMEELNEPFFAFMVALSSHTPYEIPKDQAQLDLTGYDDSLLKSYYQTVHYVDQAVGVMIKELKQKNMWDDSLVIFYGDHDSGLTKPGGEMAKKANAESPVDYFELDRQVPLFIKPPNSEHGEVINENGGQIDIAPTILDILEINPPYMMGDSLLNDEPNLTGFRDGSFRYQDLYYKPDLTKDINEGTCYSVSTEKEVPIEKCDEHVEEISDQLRLSDRIIEKNALEE